MDYSNVTSDKIYESMFEMSGCVSGDEVKGRIGALVRQALGNTFNDINGIGKLMGNLPSPSFSCNSGTGKMKLKARISSQPSVLFQMDQKCEKIPYDK